MSEPLDLDKIEEELKQIKCESIVERNEVYCNFQKQAPERIAALVKRVKELEVTISDLETASKELLENLKPIFKSLGIEFCGWVKYPYDSECKEQAIKAAEECNESNI